MKFYLVSDNMDTLVGMRLAGIEGRIAHTREAVMSAVMEAAAMDDVAVILVTEKLTKLCEDFIKELKISCKKPLIVEIFDRYKKTDGESNLAKYVREAIGVKI